MTEDMTNDNLEGETLNQNDTKTFTSEEVETMKKEMQSNSEKWVQKVISEKKNYEMAMGEISKLADDKSKLVEIYEERPEVAKIILDTIYWGMDIESFKNDIEYKEDITDPKVMDRLVAKRIKERDIADKRTRDTQKISDSKTAFIEKLWITWDELSNFENAFEDRQTMKSFSADNVEAHLEKAFREISDNTDLLKEIDKTKKIANTHATWANNTVKSDDRAKRTEAMYTNFLKKNNII